MLLISTRRVESCARAKESCVAERKQGWPEKRKTHTKEAVTEFEFLSMFNKISKFSIHSPSCPLWFGYLIVYNISLWYNPNSMFLSILHLFHFTTFWIELKNINQILMQLHNTTASKGIKKDEVSCQHVGWTIKSSGAKEACYLHFLVM